MAEPIDVKALVKRAEAWLAHHSDPNPNSQSEATRIIRAAADALEAIEKEREALASILRTAQQISFERTVTIEEAEAPLLFVVKVQEFRRDR